MKLPAIFRGTTNLLASTKGVLCIAVLGCMTYLGIHGNLDGTAAAAGFAVVTSVYCWSRSRTDLGFPKGEQ